MSGLICDVISYFFQASTWEKLSVYDKIVIKNLKKKTKRWKSTKFLHECLSNGCFRSGLHSLL